MPVGRSAGSSMNRIAIPTTSGSAIAAASIPMRTHSGSTKSGTGTNARSIVPTSGTITPMSRTTQTTDPNVIAARTTWRSLRTCPNRSVPAHPRVVVRIRPANRPSTPKIVARIATQ